MTVIDLDSLRTLIFVKTLKTFCICVCVRICVCVCLCVWSGLFNFHFGSEDASYPEVPKSHQYFNCKTLQSYGSDEHSAASCVYC